MPINTLLISLFSLLLIAYFIGRSRALSLNKKELHSRPHYYGYLVVLWAGLPALGLLLLWAGFNSIIIDHLVIAQLPPNIKNTPPEQLSLFINEIQYLTESGDLIQETDLVKKEAAFYYQSLLERSLILKTTLVFSISFIGLFFGFKQIQKKTRARNQVEHVILWAMVFCASIAILTTLGIILSVLFESLHFFDKVPASEFLLGTQWSPQTAIRADQVGSSGTFGAIPLFIGTLLISSIALIIAVPLGLMTAIYIAEYASARLRTFIKPTLEILAGIPTVVYGFFAALTVAPFIRQWGESIGLNVASESALAAGSVMGIMIIPFISSLSDDAISAVPQSLRDGAYGMGATKSETIRQIIIPAALPGIIGGILLAASRAIGETMIVVMAAGLSAHLSINPLEAVTTVTVQIVTLLTGDQAFDSPKTLAAFALALALFFTTLLLNFIALWVIRKYREQYD